jgi:hypothetical protein
VCSAEETRFFCGKLTCTAIKRPILRTERLLAIIVKQRIEIAMFLGFPKKLSQFFGHAVKQNTQYRNAISHIIERKQS